MFTLICLIRELQSQVEVVRSANGGATFSAPMTINDVSHGQQFMPNVTSDREGRFYSSWYDTRNFTVNPLNHLLDIFATRSNDDGLTFSANIQVTSIFIDADATAFIGDYNGIASGDGFTHPVWSSGGFANGMLETATLF